MSNPFIDADFNMFDEFIFRDEVHKISKAMEEKKYNVIYSELKKEDLHFTEEQAFKLCMTAIQENCTRNVVKAILEKCPPVEDFRHYGFFSENIAGRSVGIVELAAMQDRLDLVQLFLEEGARLNNEWPFYVSILEAALEGCSIDCVEFLLHQDGLEITMTEQLKYIWGDAGRGGVADICYASVASRIFGYQVDLNVEEVPLLPDMEVWHAASRYNWPLFRRICLELGNVKKKSICPLLKTLLYDCEEEKWENVEVLLTACPNALRMQDVRSLLVSYALQGTDEDAAQLKKWLEQMPGGMVEMNRFELGERGRCELNTFLMEKWEDRVGSRLVPALNRRKAAPVSSSGLYYSRDGQIRWIMENFRIKGRRTPGQVSKLARWLLLNSSPQVFREMLEADFVFAQEDLYALMHWCKEMEEFQKRYLLAVYMKKENGYA